MASPTLKASPTMSASPAAQAAAQPANKAEKLSSEIVKISEIQKATVLIAGDTCLVGVEFIPGYTGGLTDSMKTNITQLATQVDSSLKNCAITADAALYARIRDIANDIYKNNNTTAAIAEFNEMTGQLLPKDA
jgi:YhcN/YlaJ family sporulation lipoprotein